MCITISLWPRHDDIMTWKLFPLCTGPLWEMLLTQCGLVTPYGDRDVGQLWLRQWLVAWRHQAITWTNVDWSSVKSSDIHIRTISQEMSQPSIIKIPRGQWVKYYYILLCGVFINSLCPGIVIWRHKAGQHWCLMAPSHYLHQCWLTISEIRWHSSIRAIWQEIPQPPITEIASWSFLVYNFIQICQGPMC